MKKLLLIVALCVNYSCFASLDGLSNAIKKSNLTEVEALLKTIHLTIVEQIAFIDLAREVVEQRQMDIQTLKPLKTKKKHYKFGGLGFGISLAAAIGTALLLRLKNLDTSTNQKFDPKIGFLCAIAIGGWIAEFIYLDSALKATRKDIKQAYCNALDIRQLLLCWPLVATE